jgi:hypothetical protein
MSPLLIWEVGRKKWKERRRRRRRRRRKSYFICIQGY